MKKLFERRFHRVPEVICFAPGRVNLIGEHTDYNGGHVFPCAIHLGIRCAAAKRTDRELHFYSENCREVGERSYSLDALSNQGAWSDYPAGVVRAFEAFGYSLRQGADFVFSVICPKAPDFPHPQPWRSQRVLRCGSYLKFPSHSRKLRFSDNLRKTALSA